MYLNKIFSFILFISILGSAHAQMPQDIKDKFISGNLTIEMSMFNSYTLGHDELKKLLEEGRWEELAYKAYGKNFPSDIYYYLMGRSAEGLDYKDAAIIYYNKAIEGKSKCTQYLFGDACMKINVTAESSARKNKIKSGLSDSEIAQQEQGIKNNKIAKEFIREFKKNAGSRYAGSNGPLIIDIGVQRAENLLDLISFEAPTKDKFETDIEYQERLSKLNLGEKIYWYALQVGSKFCPSNYEHTTQTYSIKNCAVISPQFDLVAKKLPDSIEKVSNMNDSREIRVENYKSFRINAACSWTESFNIDPKEAKSLENDLRVAVFTINPKVNKSCPSCETQKTFQDEKERLTSKLDTAKMINDTSSSSIYLRSLIDLEKLNPLRDAFLSGKRTEVQIDTISGLSVTRLVIYRNSTGRVIFDQTAIN